MHSSQDKRQSMHSSQDKRPNRSDTSPPKIISGENLQEGFMGELKSVDDQSERKCRSVIMDDQDGCPKSGSKRSANNLNNIDDSFFTAPVTDDKDGNYFF